MVNHLPILTFHTLDDLPSVLSFSTAVFQCGMAKLNESGHQTVSLLQAVDCLSQRKPFVNRSIVITFDDGYQTVYEKAFPVLQSYGMSATVFLTVGKRGLMKPMDRFPSLNGRPMLNWHEIREMQRWGFNFGAHTVTHPDLTHLPLETIATEIYESQKIIEDALGISVPCFAYPYGLYDHPIYELVQARFACACSDRLGLVTMRSNPYTLELVDGYYLRTDHLFDLMLTRWLPWYLRARNLPRRLRRAIQF